MRMLRRTWLERGLGPQIRSYPWGEVLIGEESRCRRLPPPPKVNHSVDGDLDETPSKILHGLCVKVT
jgi:hypothetical protein